jgi:hypothetical protein
MKSKKILAISIMSCMVFNACKKEKKEEPKPVNTSNVPEFYKSPENLAPTFFVVASASSGISEPQDIDFNPTRLGELWVINKGTEATGGSTVMFSNVGTPQQTSDYRTDGNAWHFMSLPSAISFSNTGNWATSTSVLDANHKAGGSFTGPTLWSGDLNIYAKYAGAGTNGSHLDMLHGSPYCMGIECEKNNIYWVFDGYHQHIVRYDFGSDHGPGNSDHSDGKIHRYTEVSVTKNPSVPSHLVLDKDKKWLYIVDGGSKRILRMDINTGEKFADLPNTNEALAEHLEMVDVVREVILESSFGLKQPCGIEVKDSRLFISDYETGEIICIDINTKAEIGRINTGKSGIMGIKIGPDGKLWYVNALRNQLIRVDPN